MKKTILGTAAVMACATLMMSTAAHAAPKAQEFVQKAAVANLFEIESSQTALKVSQNDAVKKFAQHMIDDHTKAGDQLKATLSTANIDAATVPTALDAKHQKIEDKLTSAKAEDFDKDYIKAQSNAHDEAISLFKSYSDKGDNAALKTFASQTLPTLEQHKTEVEGLKNDKAMAAGSSMSNMSATAPAAGTTTMAPTNK